MKIYTKTGDTGTTSLVGGVRISKTDARLDAYGTLDELQAHVAYLHDLISNHKASAKLSVELEELLVIVSDMMSLGAILASDGSTAKQIPTFNSQKIEDLEAAIDRISLEVPSISKFTLPVGSTLLSYSHICRTVCRRTEREILRAKEIYSIPENVLQYINRLSDYLYILGRKIVFTLQIEEKEWHAPL